jgi:pimeloyl-ACP methyl ester carboxylesterase
MLAGMSELVGPREERILYLDDRRAIGLAEFGPADGRPILWFHGTPGARRQIPPAARRLAEEDGVRLIGVERPGVGASTPHVHDDVRGWAGDVEQLLEALAIDRVGLIGLSGGGPYVLACAHDLGDRVVAGVVLGGVAPTEGPDAIPGGVVDLARRLRDPLGLLRAPLGTALTYVARALKPVDDLAIELYARISPEGDRRAFAAPGMRQMFLDDLGRGASGHGLQSVTIDVTLFTRHWGFSVRDIEVPVRFWHGDADHIVPLDHAQHMADLVPDSDLVVRPEESHLGSLVVGDEAVRTVLSFWDGAAPGAEADTGS